MKVNVPIDSILLNNSTKNGLTESRKSEWLHAWEKSAFGDFNMENPRHSSSNYQSVADESHFVRASTSNSITSTINNPVSTKSGITRSPADPRYQAYVYTIGSGTAAEQSILISMQANPAGMPGAKSPLPLQSNFDKTLSRVSPVQTSDLAFPILDINVQIIVKNGLANVWIRDFKKLLDKESLKRLLSHLKESLEAKGYDMGECLLNTELLTIDPNFNQENPYGR